MLKEYLMSNRNESYLIGKWRLSKTVNFQPNSTSGRKVMGHKLWGWSLCVQELNLHIINRVDMQG